MRLLLFAGAIAGLAASIPMLLDLDRTAAPADATTPPVPAQAERVAQAASGRRVRIEADRAGHYRSDIRLNGRRIEGLIDTGATVLAINSSTARRIGLSVPDSAFTHEVGTANGKARAAAVRIDTIEIGRIRLEGVEALVLDDRALSGTLVGANVLNRLRRFEVRDGVLNLEQ